MNNDIYPCVWMNGTGEEAAKLYSEVFKNTKVVKNTPMVKMLELDGQKLMLLDAGSPFKPNASLSFLVANKDEKETERLYKLLEKEGEVLMPLDKYHFSEKYAWVEDKFGVNWQLYTGEKGNTDQYFTPSLMFVNKNNGKAKEAIAFYTSVFPNSSVEGIMEQPEASDEPKGNVAHAQFQLNDFTMAIMENSAAHDFDFNEGVSITVMTNDQKETDYYWKLLTENGGEESKCSWLKDKYGVSWQIVPKRLVELMNQENQEKAQKVMQAMMQMNKIIIEDIEKANNS
ncbi:VOC family protein [Mesonia sp. K7]|uniref:VOC family protein n=1 Tax=Mesonia sp. K7 TaxID=2218606 RepID=UPI000DA98D1A|nr:VOC family protein [Mesonia sp. K7]PZD79429.1 VOC family protein [Mesonia sp. K7]